MRKLLISFTMIATLLAPLTALAATGGVTDAETLQQLAAVRQATAKYHNVDAALADGYIALEECVELPGVGGRVFTSSIRATLARRSSHSRSLSSSRRPFSTKSVAASYT